MVVAGARKSDPFFISGRCSCGPRSDLAQPASPREKKLARATDLERLGRGLGGRHYPTIREANERVAAIARERRVTHALTDVAMGPCSTGETTLARGLLGSLGPGMVVLADRNFYSFALWKEARATGADLLWRTKSNHVLPVEERLDDGSLLFPPPRGGHAPPAPQTWWCG